MNKKFIFASVLVLTLFGFGSVALANHSWANFHWARATNSFTLKLGDNVTFAWDSYLATTSTDWSKSTVLDTTITTGLTSARTCKPTLGRVEVCNNKYGNNGWLGIASIWANGNHIVQGTVKLNDTYFNNAPYNTTAWKNLVMCQEIGHTFGLNHQDEVFSNDNLETCMDYTNSPGTNQHPNQHDYDQLVAIYSLHLDGSTTVSATTPSKGGNSSNGIGNNLENPSDWGRAIRKDAKGRDNVFEKDLGKGNKVLTHVFWAE